MLSRRVVVGLSGGVDSSVSALLLCQSRKFDTVEAVFMRNWDNTDEKGDSYTCPQAADLVDAQRVCSQLDIKLHVVDFVKEYWTQVFEPYLDRFKFGTPNPDVFCNREIKFGRLKRFVEKEFGEDTYLATGHYARLEHHDPPNHTKPPKLMRGVDSSKDQSYFLSAVRGEALKNVLFPVGGMLKVRVRDIATEARLINHRKKDSVGICFIGKRDFPEFISSYIEDRPGRFITADSKEDLGPHRGLHAYTIGQRAKISGLPKGMTVAHKNMKSGDITVVSSTDHPALLAKSLSVRTNEMFWVAGHPPSTRSIDGHINAQAMVRYRSECLPCAIDIGKESLKVSMTNEAAEAVSPQQIVAIYDGDICLGGGIIDQVETMS